VEDADEDSDDECDEDSATLGVSQGMRRLAIPEFPWTMMMTKTRLPTAESSMTP
jgi:hypothetical protein